MDISRCSVHYFGLVLDLVGFASFPYWLLACLFLVIVSKPQQLQCCSQATLSLLKLCCCLMAVSSLLTLISQHFYSMPCNRECAAVIHVCSDVVHAGVRALMFSGDLDWQVPWTGSQYWTSQLGPTLGLIADWRPWFKPDPLNYGSQLISLFCPVAVG